MVRRFYFLSSAVCLTTLVSYAFASPLAGVTNDLDAPAAIEADSITHNPDVPSVAAKGNVIINYGGNVLKADELSYNKATHMINGKGNIRLDERKNGNVFLAEEAELKDDFSKVNITGASGKLENEALFSAERVHREKPEVTILDNTVYTLCDACEDGKPITPFWQIKADEVIYDETTERVTYSNATMEAFGVPVLYTPYFSHPTPNATRKSGFLFPSYSASDELGLTLKTPYYWNISPEMDATFEPIITSEEGLVAAGNFRHLTSKGQYEFTGSLTNPNERDEFGKVTEGRKPRGHIEGRGYFELEDDWSAGFDGKRASDDTYLRKYQFGNEDLLTSTAYVQNIKKRDFISAKTIAFQGLNFEDNPGETPFILPFVETHHEGDTGLNGIKWVAQNNVMALTRSEGVSTRRFSTAGGFKLPIVTSGGHVIEASTNLRGDYYQSEDVPNPSSPLDRDNPEAFRVIPDAMLEWKYPLVNRMQNYSVTVEPIAQFIISPNDNNSEDISNEDSQEIELSDINLFSKNRYTGIDRVENGPRTNYGVQGLVDYYRMGSIDYLFGQSYRTRDDEGLEERSGLNDHFSDYVGRVGVSDNKISRLGYHYRLDKDDTSLRHGEVVSTWFYEGYNAHVRYITLDEDDPTFDDEEIAGGFSIPLTDAWRFASNARRELSEDGGWVNASSGFVYQNKCFELSTFLHRDFTRDRELEPSTSVLFQIKIANLG